MPPNIKITSMQGGFPFPSKRFWQRFHYHHRHHQYHWKEEVECKSFNYAFQAFHFNAIDFTQIVIQRWCWIVSTYIALCLASTQSNSFKTYSKLFNGKTWVSFNSSTQLNSIQFNSIQHNTTQLKYLFALVFDPE